MVDPIIIPVDPVHGEHSQRKSLTTDESHKLSQLEQTQMSLNDQLRMLHFIANIFEMHDAADLLEKYIVKCGPKKN